MVGCHVIKTLQDFHVDPSPGSLIAGKDPTEGVCVREADWGWDCLFSAGGMVALPDEAKEDLALELEKEGDVLDVRYCVRV